MYLGNWPISNVMNHAERPRDTVAEAILIQHLTGSLPTGRQIQDLATLLLIRIIGKQLSRGPSHISVRTAREPSDPGAHKFDTARFSV